MEHILAEDDLSVFLEPGRQRGDALLTWQDAIRAKTRELQDMSADSIVRRCASTQRAVFHKRYQVNECYGNIRGDLVATLNRYETVDAIFDKFIQFTDHMRTLARGTVPEPWSAAQETRMLDYVLSCLVRNQRLFVDLDLKRLLDVWAQNYQLRDTRAVFENAVRYQLHRIRNHTGLYVAGGDPAALVARDEEGLEAWEEFRSQHAVENLLK
jgi:hypothetical protein